MSFSDWFALAIACLFGVLAVLLGDNGWAHAHHWLMPILWSGCGLSLLFAVFLTHWFKSLFVSQESTSGKAIEQETHGTNSPTVGSFGTVAGPVIFGDYHEAESATDSKLDEQINPPPVKPNLIYCNYRLDNVFISPWASGGVKEPANPAEAGQSHVALILQFENEPGAEATRVIAKVRYKANMVETARVNYSVWMHSKLILSL